MVKFARAMSSEAVTILPSREGALWFAGLGSRRAERHSGGRGGTRRCTAAEGWLFKGMDLDLSLGETGEGCEE